jgi:hypothetical protein
MNVVQIQRIYVQRYNATHNKKARDTGAKVLTNNGITLTYTGHHHLLCMVGTANANLQERAASVYADGGGAASGMGTLTVGTDGIGGKATLGTTDGTTVGIGGRVSLGTTDGMAGIGGSGTATLGAAGMGGSVICGTVTAGTAGMGGRPGTVAAPAGAAAVSAKWRAAWQMLLARTAHATTTATRKGAAEAIVLAVAWRPWPKALSRNGLLHSPLVMLLQEEARSGLAVLRRTWIKMRRDL